MLFPLYGRGRAESTEGRVAPGGPAAGAVHSPAGAGVGCRRSGRTLQCDRVVLSGAFPGHLPLAEILGFLLDHVDFIRHDPEKGEHTHPHRAQTSYETPVTHGLARPVYRTPFLSTARRGKMGYPRRFARFHGVEDPASCGRSRGLLDGRGRRRRGPTHPFACRRGLFRRLRAASTIRALSLVSALHEVAWPPTHRWTVWNGSINDYNTSRNERDSAMCR